MILLRDGEKITTAYCDYQGLRFLRLQASRERDFSNLYKKRAPYELLQNADDSGVTKAVFILTDKGRAFAHKGKWFSKGYFDSLCEGWSDPAVPAASGPEDNSYERPSQFRKKVAM